MATTEDEVVDLALQVLDSTAEPYADFLPHSVIFIHWASVDFLGLVVDIDHASIEIQTKLIDVMLRLVRADQGTTRDAFSFTEEQCVDWVSSFKISSAMELLRRRGEVVELDRRSVFDPDRAWSRPSA